MIKRKISAVLAFLLISCQSAFAFPVDFAPGTPVVDAIRALGYRAGYNVVVNGELDGTVAMHMADTDFDTAVKALALTHNFSYEFLDEKTVLVAPVKEMSNVKTFKLNYIDPKVAKEQMEMLVEDEDDVAVNQEANTITVAGSSAQISKIEKQLEQLDVAQQQVHIKATVIELSKGKTRNMGLTFTSMPWSKDTSKAGYDGFIYKVVGAHEETFSSGNVLARPSVTTFDGRKATILMGDKVPVFTTSSTSSDDDSTMTVEYKDVGVKLEVLPRINDIDKQTVTMLIKPSVSTITEWVESGNNKAPQISERSAETTLRVKSGETIILGGLLKEQEIKNIKAIPFLSKLPILGELFKSRSKEKEKTEILIAITPTLVLDDEDGIPDVQSQKTTPNLHKKLNEMQAEPLESNVQRNIQDVIDTRNDELETDNAKLRKELEKRNKEILKLRKDRKNLAKELEKTTKVTEKILVRMDKKKAGGVGANNS